MCILIFCKLGWLSVLCVFLSYFFMVHHVSHDFRAGDLWIGDRAKVASAFIVMAIMVARCCPR